MRTTITERWQGSQKRAYAGASWEGDILFETRLRPTDDWAPWERAPKEAAERRVRDITHFKDQGDGDWFSPRLKSLTQTGPGLWSYVVERPYDD